MPEMIFVTQRLRTIMALAAACTFAGCATYAPRDIHAGQTLADVTQQLGQPTNRYPLTDGGTRLEFARGPYGKDTYMVDLDPKGQVLGWRQVLTEVNFNQVLAGERREQLLLDLGRPSDVAPGGYQGGKVWSYRYEPYGTCQWFQVSLTDAGIVSSTAYAIDPHCDAGGNAHGHN